MEIPSGARKTTGLGGNWFGRFARGIWQDIYLSALPFARVEDVEITTSVRNGIIEGRILVENEADTPLCGTLAARVSEWKSDGSCGRQNRTLFSTRCLKRKYTIKDHGGCRLLGYGESVSLLLGDKTDRSRRAVRCAYRAFWLQGVLDEREICFLSQRHSDKASGDSWHFQGAVQQTKAYAENWFSICRESGVNSVRLHAEPHPAYYLDAADEMGMLIVDETAIYGSGKAMDASSPVFLDNCRRHVQELVKRDRNHPSVVIWSLENEMRWVEGRDVYKNIFPA